MSDAIRAVLVDDHNMFREALGQLLTNAGRVDVVASGGNGSDAVALVDEHRPDVLLLDVELPDQSVDTTLGQLAALGTETRIVIITMHEDPRLVHRLLALGVSALIAKTVGARELFATLATVVSRDDVVVIAAPRAMVRPLPPPEDEDRPTAPTAAGMLSSRELEVLRLLSEARSNHNIARQLYITEGTVKRHLNNIYRKLDVTSRMEAVREARAAGLLTLPPQVIEPSRSMHEVVN